MNKRGLSALMVDGFAILFLIVFVIAMLLIFKYSIHSSKGFLIIGLYFDRGHIGNS